MGYYQPTVKGIGYTGKARQYEVRWNFSKERANQDAFGGPPEPDKLHYVKSLHVEAAIAAVKREVIKDENYDVDDKKDIYIINVILCNEGSLDVYNEGL